MGSRAAPATQLTGSDAETKKKLKLSQEKVDYSRESVSCGEGTTRIGADRETMMQSGTWRLHLGVMVGGETGEARSLGQEMG